MEQAVSNYRDEITSLKDEISRKGSDLAKHVEEKMTFEQSNKEINDRLHAVISESKVMENCKQRFERELNTLTIELQYAKTAIVEKDRDLRSTINSLNEIQRQFSEEKGERKFEMRF